MLFVPLLFLSSLVAGHTTMTNLYVDGVNQGDGVCVRMHRSDQKSSFPIEPVSNENIACGYDGEKASARVCTAKASSTITFEWREWADGSQPGFIDPSHKGPCAVYMKKVDDASADNNAAGDGWFKIWQMDYDGNQWCTQKLIDNNGFLSVKIPDDIAPGYYLARSELLALHDAVASPPDPQFYVGCAQLFVESSGTAKPATVSMGAGTYDYSMPGLTYNIYDKPLALPYPMYGPPVYKGKSVSRREEDSVQLKTRAVQDKGLKPEGCIFVRDNWCGFEVPDYNDESSCWASSSNCWEQSEVCWNTALPTGSQSCQVWVDKCEAIDSACHGGDWKGPPNKGKDITPKPKDMGGAMEIWGEGFSKRDDRKWRLRY